MNRSEIDQRWMSRKPVEGVAFLLNDSVRVTAGPHSNMNGSVISLVDITPQPVYVVELSNGKDVVLTQGNLITATADDPGMGLVKLQRWYSAQCDGDWEHQLGINIDTLDNPGWTVKINLKDTPLETTEFSEVCNLDDEREWVHCRVIEGEFRGAGGPHMLGAIIEIFVQWVDEASQPTV